MTTTRTPHVSQHDTDTPEKMLRRLELDLYYLEHRSLFLDLKILWLTFCRIVAGRKF